tara:strand:+ start:76974 stop:77498 length:525 start_codon:yes stop_codon:yes gene_type:complete
LIIVALSFSGFFISRGDVVGSILGFLGALLVAYGYLAYGTVHKASQLLKHGDIAKAYSLLKQTRFPSFLKDPHRASYHFTLGYIFLDEQFLDTDRSLDHFRKAFNIGAMTENNRGICLINIASIELEHGNIDSARSYFDQSAKYTLKKELKPIIKEIKTKLEAEESNNDPGSKN